MANPVVFSSKPEPTQAAEDPQAEEGLESVVEKHGQPATVRRAVFHEVRSSYPDNVVIENTGGKCGPWRCHQKPGVHPCVPVVHEDLVVAVPQAAHQSGVPLHLTSVPKPEKTLQQMTVKTV